MSYLNYKDKVCRLSYGLSEFFNIVSKSCFNDKRISWKVRVLMKSRLSYYNSKEIGSVVRIRNRCRITGRARFVLKFFRLSRTSFRNSASKALISGLRRN